ncbi:MAG: hypothetical protein HRU10_07995 [Opitutales bacterium]|nr:hypothetical protein [Opitutales bacterium]
MDTLHLTGGAGANETIAQVAADVFQARVEHLQITSSVALGAALRAAVATGYALQGLQDSFFQSNHAIGISPNKAAAPIYREALKAFKINLKI